MSIPPQAVNRDSAKDLQCGRIDLGSAEIYRDAKGDFADSLAVNLLPTMPFQLLILR